MTDQFEKDLWSHRARLLTFAKQLTYNDIQEAEDLVQNTFVNALRFRAQFQPGTNMRAWLMRILHNDFVNIYRRKKKESGRVEYDADWMEQEGPRENPPHEQLSDEVMLALNSIHKKSRTIALMVFVHGFSYEEAALVVGMPVGTIRSNLHRTRGILKKSLADYAEKLGF